MSEQFIPRLFLPDYTQGNVEQKKQFSQQLGKAFNETGFVTIANHGIDQKLIEDLYSEIQSFFALDEHIKKNYEIPGLFGQRGYTSKEKEKAKNANTPDLKEFWQCGQTVTDGDPVKDIYPANILITESPSFNQVMIDIYAQLEHMGRQLLMAIAE